MSTSAEACHRSPWPRRVAGTLAAWAAAVLVLGALGLSPSVPLLGATVLAGASLVFRLLDTVAHPSSGRWPPRVVSSTGLGRGADHEVASLARRLAGAPETPEAAAAVARDLHALLCRVASDRVLARHGFVVAEDHDRAREVLPPDVLELLTGPPRAEQLTDPAALDHLLDRIESL